MRKVLIIGSPGAGKSTFARQLQHITGLPLYHLDMLWHKADRTTVTQQQFDRALSPILQQDSWIIDGNYSRTLPLRLQYCDTVFFLDYPTEVCLQGVQSRIGQSRPDMPWIEQEFDPEFYQYILHFNQEKRPALYADLQSAPQGVTIHVFRDRPDADRFLAQLRH